MPKYSSREIVLSPQKWSAVKVNGGELNCLVEGKGDAIVFLHGLGENGNFFTHQINEFKKDHQVISVDQRGFGFSTMPKQPEPLSLKQWTDDVRDLLKGLNIPR